MAPTKIDQEACIASMASGSLGARLKTAGKEFLIENQACVSCRVSVDYVV